MKESDWELVKNAVRMVIMMRDPEWGDVVNSLEDCQPLDVLEDVMKR